MDKALYEKVRGYRTSLAIVKEMQESGLITADDYAQISLILAGKYGLKTSTIFSEIDLLCVESRGNIRH